MRSTIAIVSLRFNPAFVQHAVAYAKLSREAGHEVIFVLDPSYTAIANLACLAPIFQMKDIGQLQTVSHAIFLNPSSTNPAAAAELRRNGAKIFYVLHEPGPVDWNFVQTEGIRQTVKSIFASQFSKQLVKVSDRVLLASEYGLRLYKKHYISANRNCNYFPLIYDDEGLHAAPQSKTYFGFLGSICRSHGADNFISFMRYAFTKNLGVRFLIASKNPLPDSFLKDPVLRSKMDQIEIRCGKALSDEEMNHCYAQCFCVWMLYRRTTQSGVLPKAFMHGTPVIASEIGSLPEYVKEGVTGRFSTRDDHSRTFKMLTEIQGSRRRYAENCRAAFIREFFYLSKLKDFNALL